MAIYLIVFLANGKIKALIIIRIKDIVIPRWSHDIAAAKFAIDGKIEEGNAAAFVTWFVDTILPQFA
jgi:hypothetical protein